MFLDKPAIVFLQNDSEFWGWKMEKIRRKIWSCNCANIEFSHVYFSISEVLKEGDVIRVFWNTTKDG